MGIDVMAGPQWKSQPELLREIESLVAPSYVDASALLVREVDKNDRLYLGRDATGRLVCFFMVEAPHLDGHEYVGASVYMGLSATSHDTKNTGSIRALYQAFLEDCRRWQDEHRRRALLWCTTASPSTYFAASSLFADVEPQGDGSFAIASRPVVEALRASRGLGAVGPDAHPFVLPRASPDTAYSPLEEARIARVREAKRFRLFDVLGIDESRGDRLLITCRVPAAWREYGDGA